jgi:hypothetical protein
VASIVLYNGAGLNGVQWDWRRTLQLCWAICYAPGLLHSDCLSDFSLGTYYLIFAVLRGLYAIGLIGIASSWIRNSIGFELTSGTERAKSLSNQNRIYLVSSIVMYSA